MKIIKNTTLLTLILTSTGCSIYSEINATDPVRYKDIYLGENRVNVISVLGQPKASETNKNSNSDYFEFIDGNSGGYKVRVLPYLAGDLFTLGLSEIIFWPLEKFALEGSTNSAFVNYDKNSKVSEIKVNKKSDGEQLYYVKVIQTNDTSKIDPNPLDFEKTIPKIASENDIAITNYFDKIPENWPQKHYYETDEFRYWSIPSDILKDQNDAILSSKNKADLILAKEFPNKQVNSIKFETTHMEVVKYNDKYRSWRLVRVSRDFQ